MKYSLQRTFVVVAIFLMSMADVFAQDGNLMRYMNVIPPSPGASSMGDFRRPDIGLVTGTAQFSAPLTTIELPGLSIPISLSYSSNGVRVDELSGRVGMGWRIEAGGAITRTIAGAGMDEKTKFVQPPINTSPQNREFFNYLENVSNVTEATGDWDGEPDIFNFSFCGVSGKFMLDSLDQPVQMPKSSLKIVTNFFATDWNFKIIDTQGNEFYFGGTGYEELSKMQETCARTYNYAPTAWFLKKIKLYNGEEVLFSYYAAAFDYDLSVSQSMAYSSDQQKQAVEVCRCPIMPNTTTCVNYVSVQTKYLKSIAARAKRVDMDYRTRLDCGDVLLEKVTVSSPHSAGNDIFNLAYDYYYTTHLASNGNIGNGQHRYFLKSIQKTSNPVGGSVPLYSFTYNNPQDLPTRLSYGQDHWGYYNGKNNSYFVPKPANPELAKLFPYATANREVDTLFSGKGVLTKITYPTGGYDEIEYEPNKVYETRTIYPDNPSAHYGGPLNGSSHTMVEQDYGTFTLGYQQAVHIYVKSTKTNGGQPDPLHDSGGVRIVKTSGTGGTMLGVGTAQYSNETDFTLPAGTYRVYVQATGYAVKTESVITYNAGNLSYVSRDWPIGGVRVKRIKSYSHDNTITGLKRYRYASIDNLAQSSGTLRYNIVNDKTITYDFYCTRTTPAYPGGPTQSGCIANTCYFQTVFSGATTTLLNRAGNSISYSAVLESREENMQSGVIEHKFYVKEDAQGQSILGAQPIGGALSNFSVYNSGREKETIHYRKIPSGFFPVKKSKFIYKIQPDLHNVYKGCIINVLYDRLCDEYYSGPAWPFEMATFEATRFELSSPWLVLDSLIEEEYDAGVVASLTKKVVSTKVYKYDDLLGLQPTLISSWDSKGALTTINNYYPTMKSVIPGLPSTQNGFIDILVSKNKIADIVYQETKTNSTFTNAYRVNYDLFGYNVLPKEVSTYFSPGIVGKSFSFQAYDSYGNVLERSKDGISNSYVWGYGSSKPVAEVVGSACSQMAYTSFEADGYGNWTRESGDPVADTNAPTGENVFNLGSILRSTLSPTETLTLSYSYKNGGSVNVSLAPGATILSQTVDAGVSGWTNVNIQFTGSDHIKVSGNGYVDELRVHPSIAKMTSLTYDVVHGVTSMTDPAYNTKYFKYDRLGRLTTIRDAEKYLLSTFKYHYKNQTIE